MSFQTIKVRKDPNCPVCGIPAEKVELIDYEQFCGMPAHDRSNYVHQNGAGENETMKEINVVELKAKLDASEDIVVLDVRDPHELQISALDGTLRIPKGDIQIAKNAVLAGRKLREETCLADIPHDKELIVHCRSGVRSADTIKMLQEVGYDRDRMYNLVGGILAWADEIDPSMPKY